MSRSFPALLIYNYKAKKYYNRKKLNFCKKRQGIFICRILYAEDKLK